MQNNGEIGFSLATVREHYDITAIALNAESCWKFTLPEEYFVTGKISYCQEENAKYWSFYFPNKSIDSYKITISSLLKTSEIANCHLEGEPEQTIGPIDSPERQNLRSFHFTRRVYLYIDDNIDKHLKLEVIEFGNKLAFDIIIRDQNYVEMCNQLSKPLAFISHDSKDKDSLVRELARELNAQLCHVWYDEFSLKVGDSLRDNIEKGLKETKKCVVILSPNFLNNNGWGKAEFDSIYTREIIEKNNVILPVWHGVSVEQVYNYSPKLADKVGLNSNQGVQALAKKLAQVIKNSQ